ncbi:hypothetical protein WJX74_001284 [Apatococcus lobatus]|uniref:Lon N-terminal domain-containing protein n=1 Tax=Apatococcus lobatus TaxID=904363 RepID=A0AAW1QCG3_9CHLO
MTGSRRFGMALVTHQHELCDVACECEILECQPQPDGRFYLEIQGKRRFRVERAWEQDGYRVAQPVFFADDRLQTAQEQADLAAAMTAVTALADQWVDKVKALTLSRRGFRVLEVLHRAGAKPNAPTPEPLSFWVTSLIPLGTEDRLRLLNLTSTPDRITFARSKLEGMVSGGGLSPLQSCSIM